MHILRVSVRVTLEKCHSPNLSADPLRVFWGGLALSSGLLVHMLCGSFGVLGAYALRVFWGRLGSLSGLLVHMLCVSFVDLPLTNTTNLILGYILCGPLGMIWTGFGDSRCISSARLFGSPWTHTIDLNLMHIQT